MEDQKVSNLSEEELDKGNIVIALTYFEEHGEMKTSEFSQRAYFVDKPKMTFGEILLQLRRLGYLKAVREADGPIVWSITKRGLLLLETHYANLYPM